MTKNQILGEFYEDAKFNESLNKLCTVDDHREDLKHEIMMILFETHESKIQHLYKNKQLLFFTIRIVMNQYHSNRSPFYKKFRGITPEVIDDIALEIDEIDYDTIITNKIEEYLHREIHWFDSHIFMMYYIKKVDKSGKELKSLSYRKIQDLHKFGGLKIDYNKVSKVVKRTLSEVIKKLKRDGYIIEDYRGDYMIDIQNINTDKK